MVPAGFVSGKLKGKGNSVVSNRPPPKAVRAALTDITNTHQPSQTSKFDGLRDDIGNLQKALLFPTQIATFVFLFLKFYCN